MNHLPVNTFIVTLLAIFMLTACEQTSGTSDTDKLRTEIESLENQIGRLEFRIFELESHVNAENNDSVEHVQEPVHHTPPDNASADSDDIKPLPAPTAQGRYDLTPVE